MRISPQTCEKKTEQIESVIALCQFVFISIARKPLKMSSVVASGSARGRSSGSREASSCIVGSKKIASEAIVIQNSIQQLLPCLQLGMKVLVLFAEKRGENEGHGVPLSVFLDDYLLPAAQALGVKVAPPVPLRKLAKEGEKLGWLRLDASTEVLPPSERTGTRGDDEDPDPDAPLVELLLEDLLFFRRGLKNDLAQREAEVNRTAHRTVEKLGQRENKRYGGNRQLVLMDAVRARAEAAVARRWDGAEAGRALTALEKQFLEAEREAEDAMGREWWGVREGLDLVGGRGRCWVVRRC